MSGTRPTPARWARRWATGSLAALVVLLAGLGGCRREPGPNVVLITVDTLRADRIGAYGYERARTPHLDALAARGLRFDSATTPLPRTTPALASLLTGLWPHHHGSREVSQPMEVEDTLPVLLRRYGYRTIGVTANGTAGREQGFARGFGAFRQADEVAAASGEVTTARALELIPTRPSGPLFLWVHYLDPHFPYEPPAEWGPQPAAPRCRELIAAARQNRVAMGSVQGNVRGRSAVALDDCGRLYDEEIAFTDHQIGRLLGALGERGLLADTMVIVTADHGENLGEERLFFEHGPSLHDASLRVPLIVAGPGVAPGVDDGVIRLEDVMPTLLARLEIDREEWPSMDGRDQSARLRGGQPPARRRLTVSVAESGGALHYQNRSFLRSGRRGETQCINGPRLSLCWRNESTAGLYDLRRDPVLANDLSARFPERRRVLESAALDWGAEQARQRSVRNERFKLLERPRLEGGYSRSLYDLRAESREVIDVAERHPEVVEELGALLDAWTAGLPEFVPPERSSEQLDLLRALGYVE